LVVGINTSHFRGFYKENEEPEDIQNT